jgi:hypothetical protein
MFSWESLVDEPNNSSANKKGEFLPLEADT